MTTGSAPRGFSDVLRDELDQRGLTHKGFADLVGVSENSVSSWTTGQYMPRHRRMEQIAGVLNLTIDELHGRLAPVPAPPTPTPPASSLPARSNTPTSAPAPVPPTATEDDEAQRIVAALAALDLGATVEAVQRAAPPLMEILAAARRHIDGT